MSLEMPINNGIFPYHVHRQMNSARQCMEEFVAATDRRELDGFAGQWNFQLWKDFVVWLHHKELRKVTDWLQLCSICQW